VKLKIFEEARLQFRKENAWWRENRDIKTLFAQEFLATLRDIQRVPGAGPVYVEKRGRTIHKWLMPKTRCHVYYRDSPLPRLDTPSPLALARCARSDRRPFVATPHRPKQESSIPTRRCSNRTAGYRFESSVPSELVANATSSSNSKWESSRDGHRRRYSTRRGR
jgi:hypothetical protein